MTSDLSMTRRTFVQGVAAGAAALAVLPENARGAAEKKPPSERLNLACIGCGYQGLHMMPALLKRPDVQIVAVCDPNTESRDYVGWGRGKPGEQGMAGGREVGRRMVDEAYAKTAATGTYKGCKAYADFRELLEKEKDLDAVHVITPDHLHATIAIAAMKKGRHVACHKPVANVLAEVRLAVETAENTGCGTHLLAYHEMPAIYQVGEWLRQGVIGPVREVHRWTNRPVWPQGAGHLPTDTPPVPAGFDWDLWQGPVPPRPYSPAYTHAVFRGWYDYGSGCLADMGNYGLWLDWRMLDLGSPIRIEGCASILSEIVGYKSTAFRSDVAYPHASTIRFTFPARGSHPACDVFWYDGGMRPRTPDEMIAAGESFTPEGVMYVGERGKILAGYLLQDARVLGPKAAIAAAAGIKLQPPEIIGTTDEWVGAFRGGRPSRGSFQQARHLAEATCLGNLAVRLSTRLDWDAAAMKITNVASANKYLKREYRPGWEL